MSIKMLALGFCQPEDPFLPDMQLNCKGSSLASKFNRQTMV